MDFLQVVEIVECEKIYEVILMLCSYCVIIDFKREIKKVQK